jgi:two-component system, cell cycle sensor histidine kinase and response regulator CckA
MAERSSFARPRETPPPGIPASPRWPLLAWALTGALLAVSVVAAIGRVAHASRGEVVPWIVAAAAAAFAAVTAGLQARRGALRLRHFMQVSERDQRYRSLLEQTQEAVSVSVEGKVVFANPAFVEMFGYQRPLLGVPVTIFFAPGSREQVQQIVEDRLRGRPAPQLYEAVGLRADGSTFDLEVRVTPVDFEGKMGYQAILRDVTSRKRMEAGLRESEERYRLLFERSLSGVYRSTVDGRILECNRAFAAMMGYATPAEAMAQPAPEFHASPRDRQAFLSRVRREGSLVNYEGQARRKDGTLIWVIENVSLLRDEDGEETLLGTVFDISERRRLEEQLLQSQKMEAIGRLAGGISHDFNNLLTAVTGYSDLLLSQLPEDDARREFAEEIRKAGQRAAGLTHQLLAFSRRQVLEPRILDLNAVIANMERMLRRVIGEDVELTTALDPELWRARADPGQIEQAILNLVVNARDAMPRGGRLTIETANVEIDAQFARNYESVQPGPHVMVAVSDTGVGMDAELQARLFEPFFTTKERGKGTGLGLSTTYGIVKQSGGSIWVYSEPGVGTTFKVYLPRSEGPLDAPAAAPAPAPRTGTETVLLVEDEPEVRRLVERLLRMRGYSVLSCAGPAEAIAAAKSYSGTVALLLTDVILPGMNGRELARVLAETRPGLRVLYMSGYTDAAITQQGILEPGTAFLSKPFAPDALARKVREVLEADGT